MLSRRWSWSGSASGAVAGLVVAVLLAGGAAIALGGDGEGGMVPTDPIRVIDATSVTGEVRLAVDDGDLDGVVPDSGVSALMLNVKVFTPATAGYLAVFPCDAAEDRVSALTLTGGVTTQGATMSKVSGDTPGEVCIEARNSSHAAISVARMIVYVTGYVYTPSLDASVAALSCASGQAAIFDGADWECKTAAAARTVTGFRNTVLESTGTVGYYPSVAIGDDGNPVIAHYDWGNEDLEIYVCDDAACTSGTNTTLETAGTVGYYPSVAIGDDGNPVIAHYDGTDDDLEIYVCDDAACTSGTNTTLETAGSLGHYSSMAIGDDGNPVIAHNDYTNGDLEIYVCDDAACTSGTNTTLETTGDVGWHTSVAIGDDGNPIIAHYDFTNRDLELYVCYNPACTSGANQTLATTDDVGKYSSVAIGDDGNPVIAHYSPTDLDLMFTRLKIRITGVAYE